MVRETRSPQSALFSSNQWSEESRQVNDLKKPRFPISPWYRTYRIIRRALSVLGSD